MATTHPPLASPADALSVQEELAESLVRCMGRDSAIHVCRINGWAGVLTILLDGGPAPKTGDR
jgi:hypothetical protein